MKLSRRHVVGAAAAAPALLLTAQVARLGSLLGIAPARAAQQDEPAPSAPEKEPEDSALGRFLAREEEGLTSAERRKVRKQVAQLEEGLKTIREFKLTNDVPPSGTFRALKTRRSHGR